MNYYYPYCQSYQNTNNSFWWIILVIIIIFFVFYGFGNQYGQSRN